MSVTSVNKGSTGNPAASSKSIPTTPQSTSATPALVPGDMYPYKSPESLKTNYKNYNFNNMVKEQIGKLKSPMSRFSLVCNGYKFQAHIDPQHIVNNQSKRIVQLDTLTGIVLQDFGYSAQTLELRGTTGAAFYTEISKLNDVFNNQSTNASPTVCTLVLESITYSGVWKEFTYERQSQDNIYKYTIGFTVMTAGKSQAASPGNFNSAVTQANKTANALTSSDGSSKVSYIPWAGKTPYAYVAALNQVIPTGSRSVALAFISKNWSTAPQNTRSYPTDKGYLKSTEVLVVPLDWNTVLNSMAANTVGGNAAPL